MAWYSTGTISVTNGSGTVTGSGTAWTTGARVGDALRAPDGRNYQITAIASNTSMTIAPVYAGSTAAGQAYSIQPTMAATADLATAVNALIAEYGGFAAGSLVGLFGDGSAGAPGIRFASDTDTGIHRPAANQMGFDTGGVQRMLLSSAAAQIDVPITGTSAQSSPTDATAGRVLKMFSTAGGQGPFGLGSITPPSLANIDDQTLPNGEYRSIGGGTSGTHPPSGSTFAAVTIRHYDAATVWQTYRPVNTTNVWERRYTSGAWTAWTETSATTGTGANGSWTKLPSGLMICTHSMVASSGAAATWTFPAVFSAAPKVSGVAVATVLSAVLLDAAPSTTAATFSARDKTDARRADTCHLMAVGDYA